MNECLRTSDRIRDQPLKWLQSLLITDFEPLTLRLGQQFHSGYHSLGLLWPTLYIVYTIGLTCNVYQSQVKEIDHQPKHLPMFRLRVAEVHS